MEQIKLGRRPFDRIKQAYPQAPWRGQLQVLGIFLVGVVLVALVAGFYLDITADAARIGRNIQDMQRKIEQLERENEHLRAWLSYRSSKQAMEERATQLGFEPFQPDEAIYLIVPGYNEPQVVLAPSQREELASAPVLPKEYTESLFEWLVRKARQFFFPFIN